MAPNKPPVQSAPSEPAALSALPVLLSSPVDVGRLLRELDQIDSLLHQAGLRGETEVDLPRLSQVLTQTIELNKLSISSADDRKRLQAFLLSIKQHSPVLHISFSAEPAQAFIERLMAWIRQEIHPHALLTIGLQPNIGAGCVVRSTNKYFDMSLRQDFAKKRDMLKDALSIPLPQVAPLIAATPTVEVAKA